MTDLLTTLQRGPVQRGDDLYQEGTVYSPGRVVISDGVKVSLKPVNRDLFFNSQALNPQHLAVAGIESRIDSLRRNVEYTVGEGKVVVGFYNRTQAEAADAIAMQRQASYQDVVSDLVANRDTYLPKLEILARQVDESTLSGANFPAMFEYRSVVFPDSMPYGVVISVDDAVLDGEVQVQSQLLDEAFIDEHTDDLNYLLPLIQEAAKKRGISFSDLDLADHATIDDGSIIDKYIQITSFLQNQGYETMVSYKRTSHVAAAVRLNGVPTGLIIYERQGGERVLVEMPTVLPGLGDGQHGILLSKGAVKKHGSNEGQSGDLLYEKITRAHSVEAAEENPRFGIMDIQLSEVVRIEGFEVEFKKKPAPKGGLESNLAIFNSLMSSEDFQTTRGGSLSFGGGSLPSRKFTAGATSVGNIKRATVQTTSMYYRCVLVRDLFCMVSEEEGSDVPDYQPVETGTLQ